MLKAVSSSTSARRAAAIILENSRDWCNPAHKTSSCARLLLLLIQIDLSSTTTSKATLLPASFHATFQASFVLFLTAFLCLFSVLAKAVVINRFLLGVFFLVEKSSFLPSRKENGKDPSIHDQTSSSKGKKGRLGLLVSVSSSNLKVDTFDPCNGIICYPTSRKLIRLITNNAPLLSSVCYEWKRRPRSAIIVEGVPYRKCLPAELGL